VKAHDRQAEHPVPDSSPNPGVDRSGRFASAGALLILALALGLRLAGLDWGLPDLHEEATPVSRAWEMWGWGPGRAPDLNPHFFRYPSLVFYLHLLGQGLLLGLLKAGGAVGSVADFRLLYHVDPTPIVLAARALQALCGAATVWTTWRLARRSAGVVAGLAAALWLAVDGFHVGASQTVIVDIPLALLVTWGLERCVRLASAPTPGRWATAGLALGLATSAKYPGALLLVPLAVAHVYARRNGATWRGLVVALVVAACAFAVTSPYVLIELPSALDALAAEGAHMRSGHFGSEGSAAWRTYASVLAGTALGLPLALLALAGVLVLAVGKRAPWAVIVTSFVAAYALVVGSWAMKADRYLLPVLPALLALAAGLLPEVRRVRTAALAGAVVLLAVPAALPLADVRSRTRPDTRALAREWIEANVAVGSFVVTEAYGADLYTAADFYRVPADLRVRAEEVWRSRPRYALQGLPLYQTRPEESAVFYDVDFYRDADLLVTSSFVRDRYEAEPERFPWQVAFYRALDLRCRRVAEFRPTDGPGPTILVYHHPERTLPFGRRERVAGPRALAPGLPRRDVQVPYQLWLLGLNYETFGFPEAAIRSYDLALENREFPRTVIKNLGLGKARCLVALDRLGEAVAFLDEASAACSEPGEAAALRAYRDALARRRAEREDPARRDADSSP
jgi:4-amino-4-deoxy-L-arabinose transferase-like glycosyltransferase